MPGIQSGLLARHILRSVPGSTQSRIPSKFANVEQVVTIEDSLAVCKEVGLSLARVTCFEPGAKILNECA